MNSFEKVKKNNFQVVVFCGLAKAGTTLPLTLLDGHPDLIVFPEELRFFHNMLDITEADAASASFLENRNIQFFAEGSQYFGSADYMEHEGTGFGLRDYSKLDYDVFAGRVKELFRKSNLPIDRFLSIIVAFSDSIGVTIEDNFTFVCKAPHNELYGDKWVNMLKNRGKYIVATRLPTEHYLSLNNIKKMKGANKEELISIDAFISKVNKRALLWGIFPENDRYVLDYDRLLNETSLVVNELLAFIGVRYHSVCLEPTKLGTSWAGNSSRNIVSESVYKNPHKAHEVLSNSEMAYIQSSLHHLYTRMGWSKIVEFDSRIYIMYMYYRICNIIMLTMRKYLVGAGKLKQWMRKFVS